MAEPAPTAPTVPNQRYNMSPNQIKNFVRQIISNTQPNIASYSILSQRASELISGSDRIIIEPTDHMIKFQVGGFDNFIFDMHNHAIWFTEYACISGISDFSGESSSIAVSQTALKALEDRVTALGG
jgi:hypothetical protein